MARRTYLLGFYAHFSRVVTSKHVPRSERFCKACFMKDVRACVEDDKHFLLECPVYESIRMKYKNVFNEDSTTTSVLNCPDQNLFGRVLHEMLLHRSTFI